MASIENGQDQYHAGYDQPGDSANLSNFFTGYATGPDHSRPSDQASAFPLTGYATDGQISTFPMSENSIGDADPKPVSVPLNEARLPPPQANTAYSAGHVQTRQPQQFSLPPPGLATDNGQNSRLTDGRQPPLSITEILKDDDTPSVRVTTEKRPPASAGFIIAVVFSCCCCPLTGLIALMFLIYGYVANENGDYEAEKTGMDCAKGLTMTSLILGAATLIIYLIQYLIVSYNH